MDGHELATHALPSGGAGVGSGFAGGHVAADEGGHLAAADLLVPGVGELCGGSQREERLDVLTARIAELNMKPEDYWWYLELRKYGTCKHAGFGMGFERLIMYLTGIANIRDVLPFPRTPRNCDF